ncbi:hypothetical protein BLOT_010500 [Blomia tropicalis]|nr:hypothetical protein BLOT_010500 [Blomia tropicalis]
MYLMNILLSVNRRTPFIYRQFGLPTLSTTTAVQLYTNRSQQLINLKRWKHSDSKTIVSGIGGHPINVMSDENIKNCPRTKPRPKSLESLLNDNDILQEPEGTRIGLLKAIFNYYRNIRPRWLNTYKLGRLSNVHCGLRL